MTMVKMVLIMAAAALAALAFPVAPGKPAAMVLMDTVFFGGWNKK